MSDCFQNGSIVLCSYQRCMKCRFPCIFTSVSSGAFVVFDVLVSVKWCFSTDWICISLVLNDSECLSVHFMATWMALEGYLMQCLLGCLFFITGF